MNPPLPRSAGRAFLVALAAVTAAFASSGLAAQNDGAPSVFMIGDSTMASYPGTRPVHGWGQELPKFFAPAVAIRNHASSGRSSRSFLAEGRWEKVLQELRPGDFVIIQFGHNDSKPDAERRTEPRGEYRENLLRYIRETRAKGAEPILATSVVRRRWTASGEYLDTLGEYPVVTREVAKAERVPLLDMHALTMQLERELGVDGSKKVHLHLAAGAHPAEPKGLADDTHYSEYGAARVAELAAAELKRIGHPLARWVQLNPKNK